MEQLVYLHTMADLATGRECHLTRLSVLNLPLFHWSRQLFDLRAPSSTAVSVVLLNQAINREL